MKHLYLSSRPALATATHTHNSRFAAEVASRPRSTSALPLFIMTPHRSLLGLMTTSVTFFSIVTFCTCKENYSCSFYRILWIAPCDRNQILWLFCAYILCVDTTRAIALCQILDIVTILPRPEGSHNIRLRGIKFQNERGTIKLSTSVITRSAPRQNWQWCDKCHFMPWNSFSTSSPPSTMMMNTAPALSMNWRSRCWWCGGR